MKQWYIIVIGGVLFSPLCLLSGGEPAGEVEIVSQKKQPKGQKKSSLVTSQERMQQVKKVLEKDGKKSEQLESIDLGKEQIPQYHEPQDLDPIEEAARRRRRCCACLTSLIWPQS